MDGATAHHAAYRAQLVEWNFGRVRGGAVRADDGGRRDRIHGAWTMRCDAINCLASWLADPGEGARGDLIFAATDRDVRTNGEKNKTSETIRNARTRAMGTMAND